MTSNLRAEAAAGLRDAADRLEKGLVVSSTMQFIIGDDDKIVEIRLPEGVITQLMGELWG